MKQFKLKNLCFGDTFQLTDLPFDATYLFIGYNSQTGLCTAFEYHHQSGKYFDFVLPGNKLVYKL